ncbi:MAG: hypothetical protein QW412_03765 [Candidatus Aenigmatarchaeota archaeon]
MNKLKFLLIVGLVILIAFAFGGLMTREKYNLLTKSEAEEIFGQFIVIKYSGDIVNQPSCFAENFCDKEPKEVKFDKGLFRLIKKEKLELIDKEPLLPVYCECVNESSECLKNPFVFKCINKNKDITYLFYSSPAPCINYTIYILPKIAKSIEDLVKSEFLQGNREKTNTTLVIYSVTQYPLVEKVIIEPNRIILRSEQYTCP